MLSFDAQRFAPIDADVFANLKGTIEKQKLNQTTLIKIFSLENTHICFRKVPWL